ncbi:MAG: endonuclease domain-containing protein [Patescibacteria group bacterium]|nr:endonuclease domain-containing protein [Patescibacteria group bacterium]
MLDRKILSYNPKLKQLARNLRKEGTLSEVLLWKKLQKKQMQGYNFRRQKPIDNYIVDFFCPELNLAIEIDGATHGFKEKYDDDRQKKLESLGVKFLRFTETNVRENLWAVSEEIKDLVNKIENNNEAE